jgi:hypothetical protein
MEYSLSMIRGAHREVKAYAIGRFFDFLRGREENAGNGHARKKRDASGMRRLVANIGHVACRPA